MFSELNPASDEREFQRAVLAIYPLDHVTLQLDPYTDLGADEPESAHPSMALLRRPVWDAAAALFDAHGIGTHLTGRGGDPVFCADDFPPLHLAEMLRGLDMRRWLAETRAWARAGKWSVWNLVWHCSRGRSTDRFAGMLSGRLPEWIEPSFQAAPVLLGAVAGTVTRDEDVLTGCINGGKGCDAETGEYWGY